MTIVSCEALLTELEQLIQAKQDATISVATDDQHSVMIGVMRGEIHFLSFGSHRGAEALQLLRSTNRCAYQVFGGALDRHNHDLPTTPEIMQILRDGAVREAHASLSSRLQAQDPEQTDPEGEMGQPPPQWLERALDDIRREFEVAVGPLASTVFQMTLKNMGTPSTPNDFNHFVALLSEEIDDLEAAHQFTDKALESVHARQHGRLTH